ncbi:hypothetical protein HBH44_151640 [Parastagonospora nodorum]|nr:hypothetical protein HBH44_151640 [Parastagonospora nodorum]
MSIPILTQRTTRRARATRPQPLRGGRRSVLSRFPSRSVKRTSIPTLAQRTTRRARVTRPQPPRGGRRSAPSSSPFKCG